MSGSGGFYKYRCKYFLTHDCPNWVFVNYAPCADCCAAGRDMDDDLAEGGQAGRLFAAPEFEIGVPVFQDGILRYALAEVAVSVEPGADFASWARPLRGAAAAGGPFPHEAAHAPPPYPAHPQAQPLPPHVLQHQQHQHQQQQQQQQQQQLLKQQGGPLYHPGGTKMQLPPHAASKAFPVAMSAGPGDMGGGHLPQGAGPGFPGIY